MFKNYLKIAWRNLLANKVFSLINICGLAIGLTTGILLMLEVADEFSYDKFHDHLSEIHLVMMNQNESGAITTRRATPGPLAVALETEIPEVGAAVRTVLQEQQLLKAGDRIFYEKSLYTDPAFFHMMTFPALAGDPASALRDPSSIVITERTAKKLFGKSDVLGQTLTMNTVYSLTVRAVIQDVPANSSNQFDVVLPFRLFEQNNSDWINKWDNNRVQTWIELKPGTDLASFNRKLKAWGDKKLNDNTEALFAYPFSDLWLRGNFSNGRPNGGMIYITTMLMIIGVFVLLIACINFMNLATAQSERRCKEVGIRKVLGASRKLVMFQFLSEAILLALVALTLGCVLAWLALPVYNRCTGKDLHFLFDWKLLSMLLTMGLVTGLVAGSYPAFFLSRYRPVEVLKGVLFKKGRRLTLRKLLVTVQFVVSILLIIGTIVISSQIKYLQSRPLGYDPENLIEVPAKGDLAYNFPIVKNDLQQVPGIVSVSGGTDNLVQFTGSVTGMEWPGKKPGQDFGITLTSVQYDWAKTIGLRMVEGRDFNTTFSDSLSCILNLSAVRKMGLQEPVVGTKLGSNTIVGVTDDFVYNDPSAAPKPMVIYLNTGNINHLLIRLTNNGDWHNTLAGIRKVIEKENPGYPFEFNFTKDEYQKKFTYFVLGGQLINLFGCMAIFISCLGLFGLSAFLAERRAKEISIRKVLGARVTNVWFWLSIDFLKPVIIAYLLAAPLAALVMQKVLGFMDYHVGLSLWMFVSAGLLVIFIALATVSYQGIKAALANPIKSLRAE